MAAAWSYAMVPFLSFAYVLKVSQFLHFAHLTSLLTVLISADRRQLSTVTECLLLYELTVT